MVLCISLRFVLPMWVSNNHLYLLLSGETSNLENSTTFLERLIVVSDQVTLDFPTGFKNENDDFGGRDQTPEYITSDCHSASVKFENEIDRALHSLKRSQESEYRIAEQKLYAHKDLLLGLYQQFDDERAELSKHTTDDVDSNTLRANVLSKVDRIKREVVKLKHMMEISKGFGRTPKGILNEHFGILIDD